MNLDIRQSVPLSRPGPRAIPRDPHATLARIVRSVLVLATALLLGHAGHALAQPDNITQLEVALLPEYCADAQTFNGWGDQVYNRSPNAPKWLALMGKGFWAMHHYCWALIRLGRIKSNTPPIIVKGHRLAALGDLGFVIQNTPPDFIMLPEIYTKVGEVLLQLKRDGEADDAFMKARSLKPDYWPPYARWAEHLMVTGQKAKARETLEAGLAYVPTSTTLQSMYRELGGDPAHVPRAPVAEKREPE